MSYSFGVRGSTKEEVLELVSEELDKVVASQDVHEADRSQAQDTASAFLDLISAEPTEDQDYFVSVSGSVSWNTDKEISNASVSVNVSLQPRVTQ